MKLMTWIASTDEVDSSKTKPEDLPELYSMIQQNDADGFVFYDEFPNLPDDTPKEVLEYLAYGFFFKGDWCNDGVIYYWMTDKEYDEKYLNPITE